MRFTRSQKLALAMATTASAFPFQAMKDAAVDPAVMARANEIMKRSGATGANAAQAIFEPTAIFDASSQFIDVSGEHAWVAPGENDLRGPCPGLNAFANHGYLPHNGYATIDQFINACQDVVGMGPILATFLAVYGAVIDGSGTQWSIGGTPPTALDGPLGGGNGISGSHNKYESDASPTRPDLYETGNDYKMQADQFNELIAASPGNSITIDTLTAFRSTRFDTQIANNPYFFNGPFTGVLVQPAAYTFIFRFMANHSAEYPHGLLTYDVLASWFAADKQADGTYTNITQGHERIPENWYRRPQAYPYSNEYFLTDAANAALLYPKFLDVGGNTGTVNSFTGVDVANLTGGVYNAADLAKGDKFACLAYQFAAQAKPDVLLGAVTDLTNAIDKVTTKLSCPQLEAIDNEQLMQFPGYTKSGSPL